MKKCLKKAKRIQDPVKRKKAKKKCRKKFATHLPGSVRATLTWDATHPGGGGNIDLDLWVFDSNGNKARAAADTIPNSAFSPNDINDPGTETFTDLAYKNRRRAQLQFRRLLPGRRLQHAIYNLTT